MHMYATDYREFLPEPNWNSPWIRKGWLYNAALGSPPDISRPPYGTNQAAAYETGLLYDYIRNYRVYRCPLDKTNTVSWRGRAQKMSSYLMNGAVCGFAGSLPILSRRLRSGRTPYVLAGIETNPADFNDGSSSADEGITKLHSFGTTIGVVDGHIEYLKTLKFYAEVNVQTKNRLWCAPDTSNGR